MVVGLKVYEIKTKEVYENMRKMFSGIAFFRSDDNKFFMKITKNPTVNEFIELGLIEEVI
jgi:hypothetical protein